MRMIEWIRYIAYSFFCTMAAMTVLFGQAPVAGVQTESRNFAVKVDVDEVQLDAVVLDWRGRQITDLTADDFEIYQDGKRQNIVSSVYINEDRAARKASKDSPEAPFASNPMPDKEKIKQTIIFIVDDLNMEIYEDVQKELGARRNGSLVERMVTSYDMLHNARTAVRKFVDTQMQSGDQISVLRTGIGTSTAQMFSSDRQQLLSILDNMRWGATIFSSGQIYKVTGIPVSKSRRDEKLGFTGMDPFWEQVALESNASAQNQRSRKSAEMTILDMQTSIIKYCVRTIRNMPGRKSIFFLSPITTIFDKALNKDWQVRLHALADEALRSGVVIHTLDLSMDEIPLIRKDLPLSKMTGGAFIRGPSFWQSKDGIGSANELLKGYYLLSYIPPDDTFSKNAKTSNPKSFHQVKIKTKRGSVYTRSGFYGIIDKYRNEEPARDKTLQEVLYSPSQYKDINVNLSSSYAFFPPVGYFVRAWLHVDAKNLTFSKEANGEHSISIEVATLISESRSMNKYAKAIKCDIYIKDKDVEFAKKKGFDFSVYLSFRDHAPLWESLRFRNASLVPDYLSNEAGSGYFVRASVRDLASEKAGSAYQFIEIPNLKEPKLALSSFFIFNRTEDLAKILSGEESEFQAQLQYDPQTGGKSPALRNYLPGESFDYALMVYNAKAKKQEEVQLESQIVLLKDGQECFRSEIKDVHISPVNDFDMAAIVKKMTLGEDIAPGDYVMQYMIRDKKPEKKRAAVQAVNFTVQDRSSSLLEK